MDLEKKNDIALPCFVAFSVFGVLIQALNVLVDDEVDKYHSFYKGFGAVAIAFRLFFYVYFLWGLSQSFNHKI